ncbi:MAG: undecaprenyl-diphosphate phosphatase [Bacteroidales bacterium]|nr:undecaprenyl-diphosphate phosphatase [Bacteroidales bacterium]
MNWLEALILGLIQGLTEFLPVSSSGHLMIGQRLLGTQLEGGEDLLFVVLVHAATVLATIVVFRRQIWGLLKDLFRFQYNDGTDYILKIGLSMIPVMVVGLFFKDRVEALFSSMTVVGVCLLITALLLFLSDHYNKLKGLCCGSCAAKDTTGGRNGISWWQAFVIGLGQSLAVLPGLSRSGTTISTGLLSGVKRSEVAQFSFLMVLVPILGEAFLDVLKGDIFSTQIGAIPLICGFAAAFVSGLFACRVMIALVKKARLSWFAVYCALAGLLTLIFLS